MQSKSALSQLYYCTNIVTVDLNASHQNSMGKRPKKKDWAKVTMGDTGEKITSLKHFILLTLAYTFLIPFSIMIIQSVTSTYSVYLQYIDAQKIMTIFWNISQYLLNVFIFVNSIQCSIQKKINWYIDGASPQISTWGAQRE